MSQLRPKSIAVVYGTRPEIIKLAPLVDLLGPAVRLIHTGQHFDAELSESIAADLGLPAADHRVEIGGKSRASQIGSALIGIERHLADASAVVVQGDTNSSLAGAIAANSLEIPLFHVEAGLRSFDRRMPEEHNRVLIDHLADVCWAPTQGNVKNLLNEGLDPKRIEQTGNTIVEALTRILPGREEREAIHARYGLGERGFVLATIHRPENVDSAEMLREVLEALSAISLPVLLPLHPRTVARVSSYGLESSMDGIRTVPSLGYRDFLGLLAGCALAVSDSGGIQEEVSVLKIPLIVVRRSTERPEVVGTFATLLSDPGQIPIEAKKIIDSREQLMTRLQHFSSPFGDGHASERMQLSLRRFLDSSSTS